MSPQELDRIRFITRHFGQLKGLEMDVPTGLWALGYGIVGLVFISRGNFSGALFSFLLWLAFMLGVTLVRRRALSYYRAVFGEVEPSPKPPFPEILVGWMPLLVYLGGILSLRPDIVVARIFFASISALFLYRWVWRGNRLSQIHWLVLGILFLGIQPFVSSMPEQRLLGFVLFLYGIALVLGGLLDHRLLVREMRRFTPPPELETMSPAEVQR